MKSEDKNLRENNSKQEKDKRTNEKGKHSFFLSRPANMPSHHLHLIFLLLFWCRFVAGAVYWSIIELIQNELSYKNNLRSTKYMQKASTYSNKEFQIIPEP